MTDPTITTTATGRTSAPPDEVDLQFVARAVDSDVTMVRQTAADQAMRLRQELDSRGIPGERIRTSGFRIRQRSPRPEGQSNQNPAARPYEATETITVVLFELDRLNDVLSAAVDEAGVEIDTVAFTFQTATERELQQEAVRDAVVTARKKAAAAALAEDMAVGGVRSIVTDHVSRPRRARSGLMSTGKSESVESGPIEVSVGVEIEYSLDE